MSSDKLLYQIALTQISGVGDVLARNLLNEVGDEEAIFRSSRKALLTINRFSPKLVDEILSSKVLKKAEDELNFVEKNNLKTYFSAFAPTLKETRFGKEIWSHYESGLLTPELSLTGHVELDERLADVDAVLLQVELAIRENEIRRLCQTGD